MGVWIAVGGGSAILKLEVDEEEIDCGKIALSCMAKEQLSSPKSTQQHERGKGKGIGVCIAGN